MKTLSFNEISQYLSPQKINELLSNVLQHYQTEEFLEKLNSKKRWIEDKEIYISSHYSQKQFSNENWLYYLSQFKELQPKKLTILSTNITDVPGISEIVSLEEVFIGTDDHQNFATINKVGITSLLKDLLLLPKIKTISFGFYTSGSAWDHRKFVEERLLDLQSELPNTKLDKKNNYYPFTFHLQKIASIA